MRCGDPVPGRGSRTADRARLDPCTAGASSSSTTGRPTAPPTSLALSGRTVISESRPGYGAAVHAGMLAAEAEYVAVIDGDASMRLLDLVPMLDLVRDGAATMAIGRRRPVGPEASGRGTPAPEPSSWPRLIRRRSDFPIHDLAPMRVCRRDDLLALGVEDRRFGYPLELMLQGRRGAAGPSPRSTSRTTAGRRARSRRSPARSRAPLGSSATSPGCCDDQPDAADRRQGAGPGPGQDAHRRDDRR